MTKVYKIQDEVEKDIKDGILIINEDVVFECSISIKASIVVHGDINVGNIFADDIDATHIIAQNIKAKDIKAGYINAWNIDAKDINAGDIFADDINAWGINAGDIKAKDINAWNIDAKDIQYHAFCCVYQNIKCKSIKAKRDNAHAPICLDGKLEIIN